jgi:hypothetical protein
MKLTTKKQGALLVKSYLKALLQLASLKTIFFFNSKNEPCQQNFLMKSLSYQETNKPTAKGGFKKESMSSTGSR